MIEDDRIPDEIHSLVYDLSCIAVVARKGELHKNYLKEKVERAKKVIKWLEYFYKED